MQKRQNILKKKTFAVFNGRSFLENIVKLSKEARCLLLAETMLFTVLFPI